MAARAPLCRAWCHVAFGARQDAAVGASPACLACLTTDPLGAHGALLPLLSSACWAKRFQVQAASGELSAQFECLAITGHLAAAFAGSFNTSNAFGFVLGLPIFELTVRVAV